MRVSCICVTRGRVALLRHAVQCFEQQTYADKELVIAYDDDDAETRNYALGTGAKCVEVPAGTPLGEIRNMAIAAADGPLVAQWDDDDTYAPERIARQVEALEGHAACFLSRWWMYDAVTGKAYLSSLRYWEGSMLARKDALPRYPALRRGEDTPMVEAIKDKVLIDAPELYIYCFHGGNTWGYVHFLQLVRFATEMDGAKVLAMLPDVPCGFTMPPATPRRLSVCMIVRERTAATERMIAGLGFADEVVCHEAGVVDNFAKARNAALAKCTGDWVLWLDDDDMLPAFSQKQIRALMDKPGPLTLLGGCHYGFQVHNMTKTGVGQVFQQARLFPRIPSVEWGGARGCLGLVHESYYEKAEAAGLLFLMSDIVVEHWGYATYKAERYERNLRLLALEPDCGVKFYNLGTTYHAMGDMGRAEEYYCRALSFDNAPWLNETMRYLLAVICLNDGRLSEVPGLIEGSTKPDAVFLAGKYSMAMGDKVAARRHLERYIGMGSIVDTLGTNAPAFQEEARRILEHLEEA